MLDFVRISTYMNKGVIEITPDFEVLETRDLMIRGGRFYAIYDEATNLWDTSPFAPVRLIDKDLREYYEKNKLNFDAPVKVLYLKQGRNKQIDKWKHYVEEQMPDNWFYPLNQTVIFADEETKREDYASMKLPYSLVETEEPEAWNRLIDILYSPEEKHKIEWAIGSIVTGASKSLQKFMVLYGSAGTGKSTVLNIIEKLFTVNPDRKHYQGYCAVFDAKSLGSSSDNFAYASFRNNPLVAIQHDGDLSRIEDNTRLNSLVSHERVLVNEKNLRQYENYFSAFLFMGTNKPVRITDAKSGLIRRLIDVSPSGNKLLLKDYNAAMRQINFELGAIAARCRDIFLADPDYYNDYIPVNMMGASNDMFNFIQENYYTFKDNDGVSLKTAWSMYKQYLEEAKVLHPLPRIAFQEELKNYFREFLDRYTTSDGTRCRRYYLGFKGDSFKSVAEPDTQAADILVLDKAESLLDRMLRDCPAQYATVDGKPFKKWNDVSSTLRDIDTSKLHYVKPPENHIVIDFDISEGGEKSLQKNLDAASKWPRTYAELSKSGKGVHLHYIYNGDTTKLSHVFDDHIEIKTFNGGSSLRRKLTFCNDIPVSTISSGLPMKGEKMITKDGVLSEKGLRTFIMRAINKEYHGDTRSSIDYIFKGLDDKYKSGEPYDVSDLYRVVLDFAMHSTNQSEYCVKKVGEMHFHSEEPINNPLLDPNNSEKLIFFDCEVLPNFFGVCWKFTSDDIREAIEDMLAADSYDRYLDAKNRLRLAYTMAIVTGLCNPSPDDILELSNHKLVGFNNRRYDNHILYGRILGYDNYQLYLLSKRIISGAKDAFFGNAYNFSFTDVYDFSAEKKSLKKFEVEYGISHKEYGLKWDEPVPEEHWEEVIEYCKNDVKATEVVFWMRHADFVAREVLADLAGMTVNDTTNSLTTRIIFGNERHPQVEFNYRNMGDISQIDRNWTITEEMIFSPPVDEYTVFDKFGRPIFPGYVYNGKSIYRDEEVGEGGYVYAEPGIYYDVYLDDIASMHPHSIIAEKLFGERFTARFKEIVDARVAIKHKDFAAAKKMLGGKLGKYLTDERSAKDLAQALKIAINSVYGLTAAKFENPFRDIRNIDNIVAKRGALFMVNLKHEVQKRGFTVVHIKTDSIKVANATNDILQFIQDYGKMYGYTFEMEDIYQKICLVNDAVYVAKYKEPHKDKVTGRDIWWTATGTQFQVPYVFKTLFSHEDIDISDMTEIKQCSTAIYLDLNEHLPEGEHNYVFIGKNGAFNPVKPGCGGGELVRESVDKDGNVKYDSVTGTKGYRWLEAGTASIEDIDREYYNALVNKAIDTIAKYGDVEEFLN